MTLIWLHEAHAPDGQMFRIGRRGETRIAEWDGILRLEVDADGTARVSAFAESLAVEKLKRGAVPALLGHLDGTHYWHASACQLPGLAAVAVVGEAGAGKSTLTAGLCLQAGASFVADDVAAFTPAAGAMTVQGTEQHHALRPDMAQALFGHEGATKALFEADRVTAAAPLGLIVLLEIGESLELRELPPRAKVIALTRHLVRFALDDPERLRRDLDVVLHVATTAPMYSLVRPPAFHDWEHLARLLEAQLRVVLTYR